LDNEAMVTHGLQCNETVIPRLAEQAARQR
jgi:hypothetical protein